MVSLTLSLETSIRMVPSFNRGSETDLEAFITKCYHLLGIVATNIKPHIFDTILAQL